MTNQLSIIYASRACQTAPNEAALAEDMRRRAVAEGHRAVLPLPTGVNAHIGARISMVERGARTEAAIIAALTRPMIIAEIVAATGMCRNRVKSAVERMAERGQVHVEVRAVAGTRRRVVSQASQGGPHGAKSGAPATPTLPGDENTVVGPLVKRGAA